jgi:hypothetical protein
LTRTVFRVPLRKLNLQSGERNLERILRMQRSNSTVFPLPVGAEITMFTSERKHTWKHSLCNELKYLQSRKNQSLSVILSSPGFQMLNTLARQIHMQVLRSNKETHATEQEHTGEHLTTTRSSSDQLTWSHLNPNTGQNGGGRSETQRSASGSARDPICIDRPGMKMEFPAITSSPDSPPA